MNVEIRIGPGGVEFTLGAVYLVFAVALFFVVRAILRAGARR
jgi:hypothetical protein